MTTYKFGDLVKYSNPEPGEEGQMFVVLEDNGNRLYVEAQGFEDWAIKPTQTLAKEHLVAVPVAELPKTKTARGITSHLTFGRNGEPLYVTVPQD